MESRSDPWGRRRFLAKVTIALNALLGAVVAVPAVGYLLSPLRRRREARRFVRLARLNDLADGEPRKFAVVGPEVDAWTRAPDRRLGAVWLVRRGDGVVAYTATCPHLGCSVDYRAEACRFACPCHASFFAIDGRRLAGPSPRGMDALDARETDGWVEVRFERFRQGTPTKIKVGL